MDTQLIAAAPDLLAALKESSRFWGDLRRALDQATERGFTRIDVGDLRTVVRHIADVEAAAIAKAEGK